MMITVEQAQEQFADFLEEEGQGRPLVRANEEWINYAPPGEQKKTSSAKLTYDGDKVEGVFKSFKTPDELKVWRPTANGGANGHAAFTDTERQRLREQGLAAEAEKKARKEAACLEAFNLFYSLPEALPTHPYLVKKKIAKNLQPLRQKDGDLYIPVFNAMTDEFQTYQYITPDGTKRFPKDGVKKYGYAMPGVIPSQTKLTGGGVRDDQRQLIIVGEGYASVYPIRAVMLDAGRPSTVIARLMQPT